MGLMRPGKLVEHLAGYIFPDWETAARHVYFAVIRGELPAQLQSGEILGPAELERISQVKWSRDPNDTFALPNDIGLSMDDAARIFSTPESRKTANVVSISDFVKPKA